MRVECLVAAAQGRSAGPDTEEDGASKPLDLPIGRGGAVGRYRIQSLRQTSWPSCEVTQTGAGDHPVLAVRRR